MNRITYYKNKIQTWKTGKFIPNISISLFASNYRLEFMTCTRLTYIFIDIMHKLYQTRFGILIHFRPNYVIHSKMVMHLRKFSGFDLQPFLSINYKGASIL